MKSTIVCFGDSNTWGYDPRSLTGDSYPEKYCWTSILAERTGLEVINHGICGRTIPEGKTMIDFICSLAEGWCREKARVLMLIMLGTNDILTDSAPGAAERAGEKMEAFVAALMEAPAYVSGKLTIVLISPPYLKTGSWVPVRELIGESVVLDEVYMQIAKRLGTGCICSGEWDIPLSYDGVHMTAEGHRKFAEGLTDALFKIGLA